MIKSVNLGALIASTTFKRQLLAIAVVAGAIGTASASARAGIVLVPPSPVAVSGNIVPVDYVVRPNVWIYDQRIHGQRYHVRRPGFIYLHDGYYYARPWWSLPPVWVYDARIHGPRYVIRRPGFIYAHNGYYYARPWWRLRPGLTIRIN
jgi:hypothetical protein